jgi:hypothetical protein
MHMPLISDNPKERMHLPKKGTSVRRYPAITVLLILALGGVATSHSATYEHPNIEMLLSGRLTSQSEADAIDGLIFRHSLNANDRDGTLTILAYRRYLSEYSNITTPAEAGAFIEKYAPTAANSHQYDPEMLVPKASAFRSGQAFIPLDQYHAAFLLAKNRDELTAFINTYPPMSNSRGTPLLSWALDLRGLSVMIAADEREYVKAAAAADAARQRSDAEHSPEPREDWWVQLQDLGNIHCEPTQGITFRQVVSNAHAVFDNRYIFLFENKTIAVTPQAGPPVQLDFGADTSGMIHTTHRVNVLLVDGPPYKGKPPFGRMFIYSKTKVDCQITIAYAHYLLGF